MKSIFPGDMCVGENTSRPVNVRIVRHRRTVRALRQAAIFMSEKACLFRQASRRAAFAALRFRFLDLNQFIFFGTKAQICGCLNGQQAVAALNSLQQMGLTGVILGSIDQIDTGLIDSHRIQTG